LIFVFAADTSITYYAVVALAVWILPFIFPNPVTAPEFVPTFPVICEEPVFVTAAKEDDVPRGWGTLPIIRLGKNKITTLFKNSINTCLRYDNIQ
jgi:hypothetical protein